MKLGAYHTLEIELQRPFSLYKHAWDLLDLERIKQACDPAASADLAAVLITVKTLSLLAMIGLKSLLAVIFRNQVKVPSVQCFRVCFSISP